MSPPALPSFRGIFDLDGKRARLVELDRETSAPDLWDDPRRAAALNQEAARIRDDLATWEWLTRRAGDARELASMLDAEPDETMERDLGKEIGALEKETGRREIDLLFNDPYTDHVALISIHAGAGGTDSQDWAEMVLRMYLRWAEEHRMPVEFLEESVGNEAGIKSATIRVSGPRAYGLLKGEHGVHRLVRISPFDAAHRRHTSFVLVEVTPEIEDTVTVEIDPDDVRTDVFRSSGAGGQHVNKTSSAVRLTHIPTGIVVACQQERSQGKNKATAYKMLRAALYQKKLEEQEAARAKIEATKTDNSFGNQIRSYVFQPYTMVNDHRTEVKVGDVQRVMDGDLDEFIRAYLKRFGGKAA